MNIQTYRTGTDPRHAVKAMNEIGCTYNQILENICKDILDAKDLATETADDSLFGLMYLHAVIYQAEPGGRIVALLSTDSDHDNFFCEIWQPQDIAAVRDYYAEIAMATRQAERAAAKAIHGGRTCDYSKLF